MRLDWKEYFAFSKKDRVGAVVLLILIVIIAATFFYNPSNDQPPITITTLDQELVKQGIDTATTITDEQAVYMPSQSSETINNTVTKLFQFDPNTLDAAGFKRLGLQDRSINTILKYRSKGGHFWKPDDLRKIYSLSKEDADRLVPYIQIARQQQEFVKAEREQPSYTKLKPAVIDINTATVEQWKSLPAIGDVLSNRIVKFREKIGGFTSIVQVKQTYGLSDSAFQVIEPYLKVSATQQKTDAPAPQKTAVTSEKININTASANQLKSNPHIPEQIAQAIVIYRSQHGNFSSIEEVKKIVFINDEMFKQIATFLTVE